MSHRALIVVDMLTPYDFEGAEGLVASARKALPQIRGLIDRAREAGVPVIYVNDSVGAWRSDRKALVDEVLGGEHPELIEPIVPDDDAMFVVKARHSIFFQTPLEYILGQEEVESIVLVGQATEQCILYSALDAHIRHIPVVVPRDAVAHIDADLAAAALQMMERNMEVVVCAATEVELGPD